MRKLFSRYWAKFIISQLKKGAVKNESVLRVLIHYLLLEVQKAGGNEIEIEYKTSDDSKITFIILGYLTDKK